MIKYLIPGLQAYKVATSLKVWKTVAVAHITYSTTPCTMLWYEPTGHHNKSLQSKHTFKSYIHDMGNGK